MRSHSAYKNSNVHPRGKGVIKPAPSTTAIPTPARAKRNWAKYNKDLVNRGNVFEVVLDTDILNNWMAESAKQGPKPYSDAVIQMGIETKEILGLTYRSVEGFLTGLMNRMNLDLKIPHYSTFNRRGSKDVKFKTPKNLTRGGVLLIDGTGIAYRSRGAWNTIKHNLATKHKFVRCTLTVDSSTGIITSFVCTEDSGKGSGEVSQVKQLLDNQPHEPKYLVGDGAYDNSTTYDECKGHSMELVAPPRVNAVYGLNRKRDEAITQVKRIGAKDWKKRRGYHQRSRVESAIGAMKMTLGDVTRAQSFDGAKVDVTARINSYNRWLEKEGVNSV